MVSPHSEGQSLFSCLATHPQELLDTRDVTEGLCPPGFARSFCSSWDWLLRSLRDVLKDQVLEYNQKQGDLIGVFQNLPGEGLGYPKLTAVAGGGGSSAEPVGPAGFGVSGGTSALVSTMDETFPGTAIKTSTTLVFPVFASLGGLHKGGKHCQQQQVQRFLQEVATSFLSFGAPEVSGVTLRWTDRQTQRSPGGVRSAGSWHGLSEPPLAPGRVFWALGGSPVLMGVQLSAHKHLGLSVMSPGPCPLLQP